MKELKFKTVLYQVGMFIIGIIIGYYPLRLGSEYNRGMVLLFAILFLIAFYYSTKNIVPKILRINQNEGALSLVGEHTVIYAIMLSVLFLLGGIMGMGTRAGQLSLEGFILFIHIPLILTFYMSLDFYCQVKKERR